MITKRSLALNCSLLAIHTDSGPCSLRYQNEIPKLLNDKMSSLSRKAETDY